MKYSDVGFHIVEVRASSIDSASSFSDSAVDMYTEVHSSNRAPMSDVLNDVYCGVSRSEGNRLCHLQRLYDVILACCGIY
jgi:hypothetical protein